MRRISANYVFPVDGPPIRNGIVETEDDGTIIKVYDFGGEMRELAHTEFLNGVLVPGFINMHTHLEYAWMDRVQPKGQGMAHFIKHMMASKAPKNALDEIQKADNFMYSNGIVAVVDIANTPQTIDIKKKSPIRYYTFTEITGLDPDNAKQRAEHIGDITNQYVAAGLKASPTPHAPYSVSKQLWNELQTVLATGKPVSIHNQESKAENELFLEGTGELITLLKDLNIVDEWSPTDMSALQSLPSFLFELPILLVHNTFTSKEDVEFLIKNHKNKIGWVLCPESNQQITGNLPNINILEQSGFPIMLGTDSKASAYSLSLLDEIKLLQNTLSLPFEKMLNWVTLHPANIMGWNDLGSFTPGKKPGINLISSYDFKNHTLKDSAKIKKIL